MKPHRCLAVHPFLFALFPVLFLYARNFREIRLEQTLPAFVVAQAVAGLVWLLSRMLFADRGKAGVAALVVLVVLFSGGRLHEPLNQLAIGLELGPLPHLALAGMFLALVTIILLKLRRSEVDYSRATSALNLLTGLLVLLNLFLMSGTAWHDRPREASDRSRSPTAGWQVGSRPDVYYIVLDEYADPEAMRELYHYDAAPFVSALRERGFFVFPSARTTYSLSERCMAAVLNMRPLESGEEPYGLIQNSRVADLFARLGYSVTVFPLNGRAVFRNATRVVQYADAWFNDFNLELLKASLLRGWAERTLADRDYGEYFRDKVRFAFAELPVLAREKSPKFVYFHIVCPHAPFVFDADGQATAAARFFDLQDRSVYLGQYRYVNRRILDLLKRLLEGPSPPVVILQSDHGQRGDIMGRRQPGLGRYWSHIFTAIFMPGGFRADWPNELPAVDTFRLLFNALFKAGL